MTCRIFLRQANLQRGVRRPGRRATTSSMMQPASGRRRPNMVTEDRAQFQKVMNVNRMIWITTTILFALVGAMLGSQLGHLYVARTMPGAAKMNATVTATIAAGVAVVMA